MSLNYVDYFFIFIFIANIILYSWMHYRKSSGTAMASLKYARRAALITQIVFIVLFGIVILGILGIIVGIL
jgi:hypothetical protein